MTGKLIRLLLCLVALWGPALVGAEDMIPATQEVCPMAQARTGCCCCAEVQVQSQAGTGACPCSMEAAPQSQANDWLPAPSRSGEPLLACLGDFPPAPLSLISQDGQGYRPAAWRPPRPIYLRISSFLI